MVNNKRKIQFREGRIFNHSHLADSTYIPNPTVTAQSVLETGNTDTIRDNLFVVLVRIPV